MKARRFLIYHLNLDMFIANRAIRVIQTIDKNSGKITEQKYEIKLHASQMMLVQSVVKRNDMMHEQLSILHKMTPPFCTNAAKHEEEELFPNGKELLYDVWEDVSRAFLYDAMVLDMTPTGRASEYVALPQRIIVMQSGQEVAREDTFISLPPLKVLEEIYRTGFTILDVPLDSNGLFYGYENKDVPNTNVTMVPFVASASMSRTGEYLFVNKTLAPRLMERLSLDMFTMDTEGSMQAAGLIANDAPVIKPAKVSAYLGLALSDFTSVPEGLARMKDNGVANEELAKLNDTLKLSAEKTVCVRDIEDYPMNIESLAPWSWLMHEFSEPLFYDDQLPEDVAITDSEISSLADMMKDIEKEFRQRNEKKQANTKSNKAIWNKENGALWAKCLDALAASLLIYKDDTNYDTVPPKLDDAVEDGCVVFAASVRLITAYVRCTCPIQEKSFGVTFDVTNKQAFAKVREFLNNAFTSDKDDDSQHKARNTLRNVFGKKSYMNTIAWHAESRKLVFGVNDDVSSRTYIPRMTAAVELQAHQLLNALYKALSANGESLRGYWTEANREALHLEHKRTLPISGDSLYDRINAILKKEEAVSLDDDRVTAEELQTAAISHAQEIKALRKAYKREMKHLFSNEANASDGSGFASDEWFAALEKIVLPKEELEDPKGQRLNAIIFRMPWLKGLLVRLPWKEYLREEAGLEDDAPLMLKDRYGKVRDVSKCEVLFFDSMFKGGALFNERALDKKTVRQQLGMQPDDEKEPDLWSLFWNKMEAYGFMPAVAGKNSASGKVTHLNYQFVSTNGLSKDVLGEMVRKELDHAVALYESPEKFLLERSKTAEGSDDAATDDLTGETTDESVDDTVAQNPESTDNDDENFSENHLLLQLMNGDKQFGKSRYMRSKMLKDMQSLLLNQTRVHLEVEGDVRLIVGDLDLQIKHIAASYVTNGKKKPKVVSPINDMSQPGYGVGHYYAPGKSSPWLLNWTRKVMQVLGSKVCDDTNKQWVHYRQSFGHLLRWYSSHDKLFPVPSQTKPRLFMLMDAWIDAGLPMDQAWFRDANLGDVKAQLELKPSVKGLLWAQNYCNLLQAIIYNIDVPDLTKVDSEAWKWNRDQFGRLLTAYQKNSKQYDHNHQPKLYACLDEWLKAIDGDAETWWRNATFADAAGLCRNNKALRAAVKTAASEIGIDVPAAQAAVVLRNPHLCQGEDCVVQPLDYETWQRYDRRYSHLDGVLMIGNLCMNFINGADTDGDRAHLVSDWSVLESVDAANKANIQAIWTVLQHKNELIETIRRKEIIVQAQCVQAQAKKDEKERKAEQALLQFYIRMHRLLNMTPDLADPTADMEQVIRRSVTIPPVFSGSGQAAVHFSKNSEDGRNLREVFLRVFRLTGEQMIGVQSLNALDLAATSYGVSIVNDADSIPPQTNETQSPDPLDTSDASNNTSIDANANTLSQTDEILTRDQRDMLHNWYGICLTVGCSLSNAIEIDLAKTNIRGIQSSLMQPNYIDEEQINIITTSSKGRSTPIWSGYRAFHHALKAFMGSMSYKDRIKWRSPDLKSLDEIFVQLRKGQEEHSWKKTDQRRQFALDTLPAVVEEQWQAIRDRVDKVIEPENGKPLKLISFFDDPIGCLQATRLLFTSVKPRSSKLRKNDLWIRSKDKDKAKPISSYDGTEWKEQLLNLNELTELLNTADGKLQVMQQECEASQSAASKQHVPENDQLAMFANDPEAYTALCGSHGVLVQAQQQLKDVIGLLHDKQSTSERSKLLLTLQEQDDGLGGKQALIGIGHTSRSMNLEVSRSMNLEVSNPTITISWRTNGQNDAVLKLENDELNIVDKALLQKANMAEKIRTLITNYLQEVKKRTDREKNTAKYQQRYYNITRYFFKEYPLSEACALLDVMVPVPEENMEAQNYATSLGHFVMATDKGLVMRRLNAMLCGKESTDKTSMRKTMETRLAQYFHAKDADERLALLREWIKVAGGMLYVPWYVPSKDEMEAIQKACEQHVLQKLDHYTAAYSGQLKANAEAQIETKAYQWLEKRYAEKVRQEMKQDFDKQDAELVRQQYSADERSLLMGQVEQELEAYLTMVKKTLLIDRGKTIDDNTIKALAHQEVLENRQVIEKTVKVARRKQQNDAIKIRRRNEFDKRMQEKLTLAETNGELEKAKEDIRESDRLEIERLTKAYREAKLRSLMEAAVQKEVDERSRTYIKELTAAMDLSDEEKENLNARWIAEDEAYRCFERVLTERPQGVLLLKQMLHYEEMYQLMREVPQANGQVPSLVSGLYEACSSDPELLYQVTYSMLYGGAISDFLFVHLNRSLLTEKLTRKGNEVKDLC